MITNDDEEGATYDEEGHEEQADILIADVGEEICVSGDGTSGAIHYIL